MQRTIPISSLSANESIGKTLYKLLQLSKIINSISQDEIVFDFTTCKFLSIVAMSGIHGMVKTLKDNGKQVSFENLSPELKSFLKNNNFFDGLIIDNDFPIQEIKKYETKPIHHFSNFLQRIT